MNDEVLPKLYSFFSIMTSVIGMWKSAYYVFNSSNVSKVSSRNSVPHRMCPCFDLKDEVSAEQGIKPVIPGLKPSLLCTERSLLAQCSRSSEEMEP